jgi:uncharacterized damage-inducible protein DinB
MEDAATRLGAEAAQLLGQYLDKIEYCVGLLSEAQVWWRANRRSNSVGNLLLHLAGNLSQWLLAGLGGERFERHRSEEFNAASAASADALMGTLRDVVGRCVEVAGAVTDADLARSVTIQGYERDGFGALLHAVEHLSYHTGQIVLLAKQLVAEGVAIEFYPQLKGT